MPERTAVNRFSVSSVQRGDRRLSSRVLVAKRIYHFSNCLCAVLTLNDIKVSPPHVAKRPSA